MLKLEKKDGEWTVTGAEFVEDGDYLEDIQKFAGGDKELEEAYRHTTGTDEDSLLPQYQRAVLVEYVNANNLDIIAYQDFGWDPVKLP